MFESATPFAHPWSEDVISNIGSVTVGGTPQTSVAKYWNGDVPWMASGDVHLKRISDVPKRITQLGLRSSNATLVDPPAVAIGLAGQGKTRGTVALVVCRLCTNQSVALIAGHALKVVTEYLLYNLEFRYEELRSRSAGDGRAGLSKQLIEQIPVSLPPLCEQNKIAEILSTVDRAIEQTEALIAKQERIKTGLMQDLFTRGIDEDGNLRSEATHEFKDSPLGRIPKDWNDTTFERIFSDCGGQVQTGPFGSQLHSHEYVNDGVPVVMPQDISTGGIDTADIAQVTELKAKSLARHRMLPGDLIFARRGDLSKCAVIQMEQKGWLCGTGCLLMRPPVKALSSRWTAEIYRFHTTQEQVSIHAVGSTMPNLNTGILLALIVPRPTLEEQVRIEERLRGAEKNDRMNKSVLVKLQSLKAALMQDLLTGKKRVTPLI
jgi:type I restriction enzyme S subunit